MKNQKVIGMVEKLKKTVNSVVEKLKTITILKRERPTKASDI
jgi:hypothetical protein